MGLISDIMAKATAETVVKGAMLGVATPTAAVCFDYACNAPWHLLFDGISMTDTAATINRVALGTFYFAARIRTWFSEQRKQSLQSKIGKCLGDKAGKSRALMYWVTWVETFAGAACVVGLLAPLAASGLLIVTLVATYCNASDKILKQKPETGFDYLVCYLWLVEPLYAVMALNVILLGPGAYRLDKVLFSWV